jgi:hypothetical protein
MEDLHMPASPANRQRPRAGRTKSSIVALLVLCASAALAPTSASALDDSPTSTECRAPRAGDTVVLIGTQFCAVDQGSGGGWGTGAAGSAPGGRQGSEIIWASADAPRDPVVECLRRNARRCLADQFGGRGLEARDGGAPSQAGPKGGAKGAAGKKQGETAKPKADPKPESPDTPKICANIKRNLDSIAWRTALDTWKNIRAIGLDPRDENYAITASWAKRAITLIRLWNETGCGPPIKLTQKDIGGLA